MTVNRLLIGFVLAALIAGFLLASPLFLVEEIEISGFDERAVEVAEYPGDNIFNLENIDPLIEELKEDPYINSVSIDRELPDTVILNITYERPEAALYINDGYTLFNRYFEIIDFELEENKYGVPVLVNLPYRFESEEIVLPAEAKEIVENLENLDDGLFRSIDIVDFQDEMIEMKIEDGGDILLGFAEDIEEKFFVLNSLWREEEDVFFEMDYIDLTAPDRPVVRD